MAVCWVILRGQQIYTVIQAVHSLLYIVAKCHFFSVVTWKDIIQYLQKFEGCTHFCEILYVYIYIYIYMYIFLFSKDQRCKQVRGKKGENIARIRGMLYAEYLLKIVVCVYVSQGKQELIKCKSVTWMQFKSLWIKASAKCINVNVIVNMSKTEKNILQKSRFNILNINPSS